LASDHRSSSFKGSIVFNMVSRVALGMALSAASVLASGMVSLLLAAAVAGGVS
jgi:hypothetical protein